MQTELFAFTLRALLDAMPKRPLDALFLHARDDEETPMLDEAARLWREGRTASLVISSMRSEECLRRNIAYTGGDIWRQRLRERGVAEEAILEIRNVENFTTGSEARQLMELADASRWTTIGIMAVPYHLPRCLLTHVQAMIEFHLDLDLSAVCAKAVVDWSQTISRPLMDAANEDGTRVMQSAKEAERILRYSAFPPGARVATPQDGLDYLSRRDARRHKLMGG